MRLHIENIGKIDKADITIDGITTIAGANDTGKSTIGKTLWCVFNSFNKPVPRIKASKARSVEWAIENAFFRNASGGINIAPLLDAANKLVSNANDLLKSDEVLRTGIRECVLSLGLNDDAHVDAIVGDAFNRISEVLKTPDDAVFESIVNSSFNSEFNNQINNLIKHGEGRIQLAIKDALVGVSVLDNQVKVVESDVALQTEAFYLDDPYVVDDARFWPRDFEQRFSNHRHHLVFCMNKDEWASAPTAVDEVIAERKLSLVLGKVADIVSGDIKAKGRRGQLFYSVSGLSEELDLRNISTGMKTFAILKMLIMNGAIEQNGTIILDEPEIHLHPEWQLVFAEIIVLLHKEFNMHVLLNTHSPYFLRAIEVFSRKHKVDGKCRYYFADADRTRTVIKDVTSCTDEIYKTLAWPLQKLEDYEYDID